MIKKTTKQKSEKETKKTAETAKSAEAKKAVKAVKSAKTAKSAKSSRYFEAVGRRKTSVARVRLFSKGEAILTVNDKKVEDYFPTAELRHVIEEPLQTMKLIGKFRISAKVSGGGIHSQAEAVRHGISRALIEFNADFRKRLKKAMFLTRDARAKERRKFGLKKARKAAQWRKR